MAGSSLNHHRGGSGEPMALIHGIGSSWRAFSSVIPALEERHEVLALDLPGFGRTPPLPAGRTPTIEALADAVETELDEAGFDTLHVVGNSIGGWIGLELARRGRARTLVALSPAGLPLPRERAFAVAALRATYAMTKLLAPHAELATRTATGRTMLFSQIASRPWRMGPEDAAGRIRTLAGATGFEDTLQATVGSGGATGLEQIRCPVLIAWGTKDRLLLPRQGPRFVRRIPGAELRELPGLGHVPMFDDPDMVAGTILGFAGRHMARRATPAAQV